MLVRGCENRSVNALIVEKQKAREDLYLIGIPCEGIIDWRKIVEAQGESVVKCYENPLNSDEIFLQSSALSDDVKSLQKVDYLHDSCLRCKHQTPVSADLLIGEASVNEPLIHSTGQIDAFESLKIDERFAFFQQEAERCIRCYACREACPSCYCTECFVDHIEPRWTESGATPAGMQGWQIVRAFHQTGRCTDCGACERACPMDIKMTYLTEKLNADMLKKYDFETGMDTQTQPPFATVTLDDKNRFVLGGK
jgi:ferredoxin